MSIQSTDRSKIHELIAEYKNNCSRFQDTCDDIETKKWDWQTKTGTKISNDQFSSELDSFTLLQKEIDAAKLLFDKFVQILTAPLAPISDKQFEILAGLGANVSAIKEEWNLYTSDLNELKEHKSELEKISKKMDERLPKAAQELDALAKYMLEHVVEWRFTGWVKNEAGFTPYLDRALEVRSRRKEDTANLVAPVGKRQVFVEDEESISSPERGKFSLRGGMLKKYS